MADPGVHWNPPFCSAVYQLGEILDLVEPPYLKEKSYCGSPTSAFEQIPLLSNVTDYLEHAIFHRKWAWSTEKWAWLKNFLFVSTPLYTNLDPPLGEEGKVI